jgi:hypothetical protein
MRFNLEYHGKFEVEFEMTFEYETGSQEGSPDEKTRRSKIS